MTRQRRGQTEGGGTSKLCYCAGGGANHKPQTGQKLMIQESNLYRTHTRPTVARQHFIHSIHLDFIRLYIFIHCCSHTYIYICTIHTWSLSCQGYYVTLTGAPVPPKKRIKWMNPWAWLKEWLWNPECHRCQQYNNNDDDDDHNNNNNNNNNLILM